MVSGSFLISFFYMWQVVFPAPLVEETVFSPLHIFAIVKNKVSIGVWIYIWVFYLIPLVYMSVFVAVSYCIDDVAFSIV